MRVLCVWGVCPCRSRNPSRPTWPTGSTVSCVWRVSLVWAARLRPPRLCLALCFALLPLNSPHPNPPSQERGVEKMYPLEGGALPPDTPECVIYLVRPKVHLCKLIGENVHMLVLGKGDG